MSKKKSELVWIAVVILVLISIIPLLGWMPWGGYMPGMMGMMGYRWGLMSIIPLAYLVLIALGAYFIITEFTATDRLAFSHGERPLEILKERYAKGEIASEQYLKMKNELES